MDAKIVPTDADEFRLAITTASETLLFAEVGHHPSATKHFLVTSIENMFIA
jgi:hypothetical protein